MPDVTISIVSAHSVEMAMNCVFEVLRNSIGKVSGRLILTSNGNPQIVRAFRQIIDKGSVVENLTNEGFIPANRWALYLCRTPFFITLNDDVTIEDPEWLPKMLAPFADPQVAAVGVAGNPCQLSTPGVFKGSPGERVDYVEMSCAAFRTDAIRQVDAFPEWLEFAYGEDVHTGIALNRAGYKLVQVPVNLKHEGSATAKTMDLQAVKNRNHAALAERYGDFWNQHVQKLAHA